MKNNFFNNLYFFSKLSTSFILLIILIFFGFLFYKSYEYEDDNDANNLNIMINSLSEKIDNIDKDLDKSKEFTTIHTVTTLTRYRGSYTKWS